MTESRKLRVFLCHSSQDKPIVRELYQRLLAEGWIDPWLDEEKLLPGQDWDMEIEKAVELADVVIVCLSNGSVSKEGYVQKELRQVLDIALGKPEETIFIIPLRFENCELPRRLRLWHYVDFFPVDHRTRTYQLLLQSLNVRFNQSVTKDDYFANSLPPDLELDEYPSLKKSFDNINSSEEKSSNSPHVEALSIISGICGGLMGLNCYYLPWMAVNPQALFEHTCTGLVLSTGAQSWCYSLGSPLFFLIPALFMIAMCLTVYFWWKDKYGLSNRLIDTAAFGVIILLSHLPQFASRLIPLSTGLLGTVIAFVLIFFGGIYQSFHDSPVRDRQQKSFWSQRLLTYLILLVFFSFILYATGGVY